MTYKALILLLAVSLATGCGVGPAGGEGVGYDPSANPGVASKAAGVAFPKQAATPCVDGELDATWKCGTVWCDSRLDVQSHDGNTTDFYQCWVHRPSCTRACFPTNQVCVIGHLRHLHISKRRTHAIREGAHIDCPSIKEDETPAPLLP